MVRKRYSKKSKSVWRKKTDISDVEAHLEEVRRDERLGGPASLKSNDELFYVERGTEDAKSDQVPAIKEKKNRKRKPLTIESLLKPVSKVEAIKRKTNSKDYNLDLELKKKKKLIGKTSNSKEKVPDNSNSQQVYSLWQSDESLAANNSKGIKKGDQIASTTKDQYKRPVSVAKIETEVPNVQICSSGASYNPAYDDHQVLLRDAIDEEMKSLKKQEKLDRKLALPENFQNDVTTWKEEMSCGLFQTEENEDDVNSSASDDDIAVGNTRTGARRRLTLREKRLKKIRKLRAMANNDVKLKKSRMQDIYRLRKIKSKLNEVEEISSKKQQTKELKLANSRHMPKRLGKLPYEEPKIDIKLSTELTGSLRTSSVEGNLFKDRFKSFQRRGIIESRKPVGSVRKRRVKFYEKKSYRD
ncbi:Glioma tumor suppressor candidate region gene 2 protein [Trichoplax sp. H2]|nr:Glioma tumor suppressor candidate region gene 2 protein [Trichoplax sp. H2]|eukprot:RDD44843.1 Glioma tumor suppressor candidate region gene 2 protein [Trichoplax sp. H2]